MSAPREHLTALARGALLREQVEPEDQDAPFAEPVRSVRTFETAIENIIAGIERARLRSGERLPNETELAAQLGLSKPTLRQALRVLERSGLLAVKQGNAGGIFLKSDYLATEAISSNIALEESAMIDTLRARRLIEGTIARQALVAANADDLDELARTVDLLLAKGISMDDLLRADTMFHRTVARAAHNRVLEEALHVVYKHFGPIRAALQETEPLRVHAIHQRQLVAMQERDPDALDAALDAHFRYLETPFADALGRSWADLFAATAAGR